MMTALVTGASYGIGLEISKLLALDNHNLVLVSRSAERLQPVVAQLNEKFPVQVTAIPLDLSVPGAAQELKAELNSRELVIDILVNNAGIGLRGKFSQTAWESELQMMQLNMITLTELTKLLLPGMLSRKYGKILNVSSLAAYVPGPLMAVYFATKAYVLSFSEALAEELKGTGVTVTALCPGPTKTNFAERAGAADSFLFQNNLATAEEVAKDGYEAMKAGKSVVISGIMNNLVAGFTKLIPRRWSAIITKKLNT
jgi:short-subunit dehydrogenase